jgi:hypothetical protein
MMMKEIIKLQKKISKENFNYLENPFIFLINIENFLYIYNKNNKKLIVKIF